MNKTVLIVAAHPDDEVLGCGGTIARHAAEGDVVHVVFMADGEGARPGHPDDAIAKRQVAASKALKIMGGSEVSFLGFMDNSLDVCTLLDLIKPLERIIVKIQPHIVYTHHHGDLNIDHELTHRAVMTACRPRPGNTIEEIYCFEIVSSTEWNTPGLRPFTPMRFVDITRHLETKIRALEVYAAEMQEFPHARSVENVRAIAAYRGASVGFAAAEAFCVARIVLTG